MAILAHVCEHIVDLHRFAHDKGRKSAALLMRVGNFSNAFDRLPPRAEGLRFGEQAHDHRGRLVVVADENPADRFDHLLTKRADLFFE